MRFLGRCHCGAIGFNYETARAPADWSVRACECSFCRAHAALSTSDPAGLLAFHSTEPARLERYRFGLKTADFLLCNRCGVYVGAAIVAAHGRYGIINLNVLTPLPAKIAQPQRMSYEDESVTQRSLRREQRWTPIHGGILSGRGFGARRLLLLGRSAFVFERTLCPCLAE